MIPPFYRDRRLRVDRHYAFMDTFPADQLASFVGPMWLHSQQIVVAKMAVYTLQGIATFDAGPVNVYCAGSSLALPGYVAACDTTIPSAFATPYLTVFLHHAAPPYAKAATLRIRNPLHKDIVNCDVFVLQGAAARAAMTRCH